VILSCAPSLCSKSRKEKKKRKEKINNDLAILPSHDNGVMYKERKVYVPKDDKLRAEIIRLHHDTLVEGHGGQWKMVELVTQNFWWQGITKEVKQYIEGCNTCQHNKNYTEQPAGKLMPNLIPEKL